jgi:hypothetical protein
MAMPVEILSYLDSWEACGSNIGPKTGYPDEGIFLYFLLTHILYQVLCSIDSDQSLGL